MTPKALPLALVAALAMSGTAVAKATDYVGKTDSGHKVKFTIKDGRMYDLQAGVSQSKAAARRWAARRSSASTRGR